MCGVSLAVADDLAIAGLVIGQRFDQEHLQTLLQRPQCNDQHCRGYLEIGFMAYTEVDGKNQKISTVVVTLTGEAQYKYVLKYLTLKYGEPQLLPNKAFQIGQHSIVESGIAEWHDRNGVVLRISEDEIAGAAYFDGLALRYPQQSSFFRSARRSSEQPRTD